MNTKKMEKSNLEVYSPEDMKAAASMCLMRFSTIKNVDQSSLKVQSKQEVMSEIRTTIKEVTKAEILDREHNASRDLESGPFSEYKHNRNRRGQKTTNQAMEKKRKSINEVSRKSRFEKTRKELLNLKLNECTTENIETMKTYIAAYEEGIEDFEKLFEKIGCDSSFMDKLREPYQHDYTNKFRSTPDQELKKDRS